MKDRLLKVIFRIISLLLILFGYYFLNKYYNFGIPCIFHKLTGLYCPGCGFTRCIFSLMEGDIVSAYNHNRLVFILLPFIVVYIFYMIYLYIYSKKDKIICKIPNVVYYILIIISIVFGIIRNMDNFSYLKP